MTNERDSSQRGIKLTISSSRFGKCAVDTMGGGLRGFEEIVGSSLTFKFFCNETLNCVKFNVIL